MDLKNMAYGDLFHVHTYRCGHAGDESDELYIKEAVKLGASCITFTDHAPFPDNPFPNRMRMEQLEEYVHSLRCFREQYKGKLDIKIGLEIEYFPGFGKYYESLVQSGAFDVLMLGQHFCECADGGYSFSLEKAERWKRETKGIWRTVIEGIKTGYFQVVAHPDRMFRGYGAWNGAMEEMSGRIIETAGQYHVLLEQNIASMKEAGYYRREFWKSVPENTGVIIGTDAHSVRELEEAWRVEKTMVNKDIVTESDVCKDILNDLVAGYVRYGRARGIDLRDGKTDFSRLYCQIVTENKKARFYRTRQDIIKCNKLIADAKAGLEKIGGTMYG
ncbi:MAG: histidinol-phosphatase [Roseburia sp.]|nr:histidinol-phosphatase [Roseburia sp.]